MLSAEIIRELRDTEADKNWFALLTVYCVQFTLYSSCISYAFYIFETIQSCTHYLRERVEVNMQEQCIP